MLSIRSSFKPARLASVAFAAVALCASLLGIASCSMMHDDIDPCPPTPTRDTGLFVRFVYDYNTQRADMFKDHVGYVQLNVFDEAGQLVLQRTVSNTETEAPLARYGYTMHFTPEELPAGHRYRLQAIGMQKDWDAALLTSGAKYRMATSVKDTADVRISLDREATPQAGNSFHAVSAAAPLDTLWHTLKVTTDTTFHKANYQAAEPTPARTVAPYSIYPIEDQLVSVAADSATYATVSLIRDTKELSVTLRQLDEPANISADDFTVSIYDANPLLGSDNAVLPSDRVVYTPYAQWTSSNASDGITPPAASDLTVVTERTAHYDLMFNRLMLHADGAENATLVVRNKQTGEAVVTLNLPEILATDRSYLFQQGFGPQEYLDREHNYTLHFFLNAGKWVSVDVNILGWSKRIYNIGL